MAACAEAPIQPVTARPRATMTMALVLALLLAVGGVWVWIALGPQVQARVTWYQLATLAAFLAFMVGFLVAIALSYVRADRQGLVYRNLLGTRSLAWVEIDHLRYRDGDPFAYAYLVAQHPSGRERVQLLGIQQTDGDRARALFERLSEQRPSA